MNSMFLWLAQPLERSEVVDRQSIAHREVEERVENVTVHNAAGVVDA